MRYIVASVVVLTTVLAGALTVAGAGEPVKPLAGFEPAEVQKWGWKEKDGGYAYSDSGGARGQTAKGEATQGEWALVRAISDNNKLGYVNAGGRNEWLRHGHGKLASWAGHFRKWFPTDWSGYARLRMDFKSSKAAVRVRVMLYDEIALPPVIRLFDVPAGEWVTLDVDLAGASALRELPLGEENQKRYEVKVARLRLFNPAKMANLIVMADEAKGLTDLYLDNVRLVADAAAEKPAHKLVADPSPFPEPKELAPSAPRAREPVPAMADNPPAGREEPVTIDITKERQPSCYGPLGELVRHGITAVGRDRLALAQADYFAKYSLDGGKSWQPPVNMRHSSNAPGVGVAAAGPDLLGVYNARCACGGSPTDTFFREFCYDGKGWTPGAPHLVDVDSWHCPEFRVEVIRLQSGRIWAAWFQDGRDRVIHVKARYSDDGGALWRDPDSNGLTVHENRQHTAGPLPMGVTWWWEEPAITPPAEKANGRIGRCHPHTNLALAPYGGHVAVIWGMNDREVGWSRFDGQAWSAPQVAIRQYGAPGTATTLGEKEIHFTFGGKVWRLDGEKWVEDSPAGKGPSHLVVAGQTLVCIGKNEVEADGKRVAELWASRKTSGGAWSAPEIFAREETVVAREGAITVVAPQYAPAGFVPVAWAPHMKAQWVRLGRIPVEPTAK